MIDTYWDKSCVLYIGIGLETSIALANKGWNVIATAFNELQIQKVRTNHNKIKWLVVDVRSESSVKQVVDFFKLNPQLSLVAVINNAAVGKCPALQEY